MRLHLSTRSTVALIAPGRGRHGDESARRTAPRVAPSVDGSGARGYPRPQLRRAGWECLNGRWEFAIDAQAKMVRPDEVRWERTIVVPFSPETPASGVA